MSYIPAKKMPHVTAKSGEFDAETGKIVHLNPEQKPEQKLIAAAKGYGWLAGAAGAGLAAMALGAFLTLRSSSAKRPTRRRSRAATKPAAGARRRRTPAKAKNAA